MYATIFDFALLFHNEAVFEALVYDYERRKAQPQFPSYLNLITVDVVLLC